MVTYPEDIQEAVMRLIIARATREKCPAAFLLVAVGRAGDNGTD
jgi:hypothetical protein